MRGTVKKRGEGRVEDECEVKFEFNIFLEIEDEGGSLPFGAISKERASSYKCANGLLNVCSRTSARGCA